MRSNVDAPHLLPRRNSLLDVANIIQPGDERWYDGINFTPHGCEVIFGHDTKCWSPRGDKAVQECHPYAQFYPYVLEATLAWHTVDLGAGPKEMLREAFEMGTSSVLARLSEIGISDPGAGTPIDIPMIDGPIVTGSVSGRAADPAQGVVNPHFVDFLPIGVNVPDARVAIATVDAKLIDSGDHTGSAGTVYMNPITAALGRDALCVEPDGSIYTLGSYSRVVIDNFTGPDDTPAVYGHVGGVDVYLGDIDVVDVVEHAANEYIVQAERMAVAVWNTCATFYQTVGAVATP